MTERVAVDVRYAGFWRRLAGVLIDIAVLAPLSLGAIYARRFGMSVAIAVYVAVVLLGWAYHLLFLARHSATPGKLALGLRVRTVDGGRIAWPEILKRRAVPMAIAFLVMCSAVIGLSHVADWASFAGQSYSSQSATLKLGRTSWGSTPAQIEVLWIFAGAVSIVVSRRKRALHDYLAGTVVVRRAPAGPAHRTDAVS